MGARRSWCAICEEGHISTGFSGGPDESCNICEKPIIDEHNCWNIVTMKTASTDELKLTYREFVNDQNQLDLDFS